MKAQEVAVVIRKKPQEGLEEELSGSQPLKLFKFQNPQPSQMEVGDGMMITSSMDQEEVLVDQSNSLH